MNIKRKTLKRPSTRIAVPEILESGVKGRRGIVIGYTGMPGQAKVGPARGSPYATELVWPPEPVRPYEIRKGMVVIHAPRGKSSYVVAKPARTFEHLGISPQLKRLIDASPEMLARVGELERGVRVTFATRNRSRTDISGYHPNASLDDFRPDETDRDHVVHALNDAEFTDIRVNRFSVTATGPARLVSEFLGASLSLRIRPQLPAGSYPSDGQLARPEGLFVVVNGGQSVSAPQHRGIDKAFLGVPPILFGSESATPPAVGYPHLSPADVASLLRANPATATGEGISIGVVDSGFYEHAFYAGVNGYKPTKGSNQLDPTIDDEGHGTAIAWNVFTTAPDANVLGFKFDPQAPWDAFEDAVDAGVDVVSCSWGWDGELVSPTFELTLRDVIANERKIILFASGNGHYAWPASMPEVIAVGGAFSPSAGVLKASDFASGFVSSRYSGRNVPDVCGVCGETPNAILMVLPTQPGSAWDQIWPHGQHPDCDETTDTDGWAGMSGTSSATPQVAGVVAMLLQTAGKLGKELDQNQIRDILQCTAQPVSSGASAQGAPTTGQPNVATGHGLVDADAAIKKLSGT